jgi:hypothetical protein
MSAYTIRIVGRNYPELLAGESGGGAHRAGGGGGRQQSLSGVVQGGGRNLVGRDIRCTHEKK